MLHKKIEKLIPFISENFITYPLWEEGQYIPFINIWQICDNDEELNILISKLDRITENCNYVYDINLRHPTSRIHEIAFYPNFSDFDMDCDPSVYDFVKPDRSIEEMVDLLITII